MNIKVITRHGPSNYGSLLQSIAIEKVINSLGHNVYIIDYQREDERGMEIIKSYLSNKPQYSKFIKKILYIAIRYPVEAFAQSRFDRMREKYLVMTPRYNNFEQLSTIQADLFMTGSDQVWGPMLTSEYDPAYFLQFVNNSVPKVAYASSFGKTVFNDTLITRYKKMLSEYSLITVREQSAFKLLKEWGLTNCLGNVLDPTLLLNASQWSDVLSLDKVRHSIRKPYILLYLIHNCPEHSEYARRLSKIMGLPIVRVNPYFHQFRLKEKFVCCPDVSEFVSLMQSCSLCVTDSFHGTCFAINFNKQFIELLPINGTSTRNMGLLQLTGLSERIVTDYSDFRLKDLCIDYTRVNNILEVEREKSINTLKTIINVNNNRN